MHFAIVRSELRSLGRCQGSVLAERLEVDSGWSQTGSGSAGRSGYSRTVQLDKTEVAPGRTAAGAVDNNCHSPSQGMRTRWMKRGVLRRPGSVCDKTATAWMLRRAVGTP